MAHPSWHDRLFKALLRLFPAEFRGDFGESMSADFRDQRTEVRQRPARVSRLWFRTCLDLLSRAPREHLDVLARDAAYALRMLRRHPASSAIAVLSLAVGIGLNSAVYSVVNAVLWRSLPLSGTDRLVSIGMATPSSNDLDVVLPEAFRSLHTARTLDRVAGTAFQPVTIVEPGEPTQVTCLGVTPGFFQLIGASPVLGRALTQEDYDAAAAYRAVANKTSRSPSGPTVMIGHDLWRRRFGGDPDVVGRSLTVAGGQRIAIVGVMGPELDQLGPLMPGECWFAQPVDPTDGTWLSYLTFGRLAPGTSLAQVNAELASLSSTLGHDPISKEPRTLRAMLPLDRAVAGVRTQLLFVFGAVACVLLVTCANVVNLFLAHAAGRRDELSTRVALGASRARLVRQSLTESLTVSLLGGTLGFLLAVWSVPVLVSLAPADLPRLTQIGVDWSTFLFTLGVSVGSGLLCGLLASLPARLAPRTLVGAVHAATTPRTMRLRRALTVCEIALALMLVVAASLMVRTVRALDAIDLGFDPRQVVVARLNLDARNFARTQDRHMAIVERVKALPGITAAGIGSGPLTGGMGIGGLVVPGNPREFDFVRVDAVSPGYFEALGARLVAGRFFEPRDAVRAGPRVILVNQTAARAFWNGDDPIGKSVVINETEELRVLGVIADIRGATLEQDPGPAVFQVANQSTNFLANSMLIRVDGDPEALVRPIRDIIRSVNREAPFTGVEPLQQRIDRAMAPRLFVLRVVGLFTIIGLMLAVVGVYGVIAELAVQRVPEIGVRMAFGATASNVLALILGQGARLVSIGLVLGLIGAGLLRGAMTSLVYGVRTSDPLTYAAAAIVLFAAAVAACAIPAVLASRLDPATALRTE